MWATIGWVIAGSLLVASLMELIKHKGFENDNVKWKLTLLGLVLSGGVGSILYFGFALLGAPLAIVFYTLGIYVIQKQLDMKAIRPIIKNLILKKANKL